MCSHEISRYTIFISHALLTMQCCTGTAQPVGLVNIPYLFILCLYTDIIYIKHICECSKPCTMGRHVLWVWPQKLPHPERSRQQAYQVRVHASDTTHARTMVEALQLSSQVRSLSFQVPSEIMGSIVKVCLGFITPMVLFSAGSSGAGGGLPCEVCMY